MRKTPEDFYELYTTKFRPRFFDEVLTTTHTLDVDFRFEMFAWSSFMLCFISVYGALFAEDVKFETPTLSGILESCSPSESVKLFRGMRVALDSGRLPFSALWFRELACLRFDVEDSELDVLLKTLMRKKR